MLIWICISGAKDSWAFVKGDDQSRHLIIVWKSLGEWHWNIVGTPHSGKNEARGMSMRQATDQLEAMGGT